MEQVTINPNWKRRDDLVNVDFAAGDVLGDLATANGFDPIQKNLMTAIINGEIVEDWQSYQIVEGDHIRVLMLPRGHGGGKKALMAVAAIAIAVVSYGAGAAVAASYGAAWGAAASAAVSVAGSVIMGAVAQHLYKPPAQSSFNNGQEKGNPFFDISPSSNMAQPYGTVPMLLGKMKMYPRMVSQPEVESVGDHRTIIQAFDFGYGTLELENERFGNASITNNPALLEHYVNADFNSGSDLVIANRLIENMNINTPMMDEKSVLTFTTPLETKEILIEFNVSGGLVKYLNNGNKEATELLFDIYYRKVGELVWINGLDDHGYSKKHWFNMPQDVQVSVPPHSTTFRFYGKVFGTVRMGINLAFSPSDQYEIRIRRKTPSGQANNISNACTIDFVRAIQESAGKVINLVQGVNHTVAELKVRGTELLNGRLDNYSAIATSKVFVWDERLSTWDQQASRNPAWLMVHVLTTPANKHALKATKGGAPDNVLMRKYFDVDKLLEWAKWCDRYDFYCDTIISAETTVREVLNTICSAGLATWVRHDGRFSVVYEGEEKTPVHIVTPNNSKNFKSTMSYAKSPIGMRVKFANEELDYQQDEIIVNADYTAVDAQNQPVILQDYEQLELPNVTNIRQATIIARFFMAQAVNRRERITFDMDINNLAIQRGDVVAVSHDVLASNAVACLVMDVDTHQSNQFDVLEMSEPLPATSDPVLQDAWGKMHKAQSFSGTHAVVPKSSFQWKVGDLFIAGGSTVVEMNYMVEDIRASKDLSASISAVEYGGSLFDSLISGSGIPARRPKLGYDTNGKILPLNVRAIVENIIENRLRYYRVTLQWNQPNATVDHFIITDADGNVLGNTVENKFILPLIPDTDLVTDERRTYTVTPVSITGAVGAPASVNVDLVKDRTPPFDVTEFSTNVQDQLTHLTWRSVQQEDVAGYEIRYSSDTTVNASWGNSVRAVDFLPWDATEASVPSRIGTYFIKAFDGAGNYSANAASSTTIIGQLDFRLLHRRVEPARGSNRWANVANAISIIHGATQGTIELEKGAYEGIYHLRTPADLGQKLKVHISAQVEMAVIALNEFLDDPWFDPLQNAVPLSPTLADTPDIADAQVYFRVSDNGTDWTPWVRLLATDVDCRYIDMQVRLYSKDGVATPRVSNAMIEVEFTRRFERGYDIAIPSAGKQITFDQAYAIPSSQTNIKPSVAVTLQNAHAGDTYIVSNKSNTGFKVQIFDSSGSPKAGEIDWVAVGYGKHL